MAKEAAARARGEAYLPPDQGWQKTNIFVFVTSK